MIPMMIKRSHNLPPKNSAAHRSRVFFRGHPTQPPIGSGLVQVASPLVQKVGAQGGATEHPKCVSWLLATLFFWRLKDMFRVARCFYFWNIQVCFLYIYIYISIYIYIFFRIFDRTMNDRIVFFKEKGPVVLIQSKLLWNTGASERLGGLVFPLVLGASLREANCGYIVGAYCKCWFNFLESYRKPLC